MNNISTKNSFECAGCTACMACCPQHAISMTDDALGFKYPKVDETLCNNCGKCIKICPFKERAKTCPDLQHFFALRHEDTNELSLSQSGGAFVILSDYILEKGGVIYGVGIDSNFLAHHQRADNKEGRDQFRYSKYIQSELGGVIDNIREDLEKGKIVLFSGTPCQVAGLNASIRDSLKDNLYTIDLICHGVASPSLWKEYTNYIIKKHGVPEHVLFRDKTIGWKSHKESFIYPKKKITRRTFASLYYSHLALRKSCYDCKFTNYNRPSDITIADLWGWNRIPEELNDNKGISVVFTNTEKGLSLYEKAKRNHYSLEINKDDFSQPQLNSPIQYTQTRESFETEFTKYGFKYVGKKYGDLRIQDRFKDLIRPFYHKIIHALR